MEVLYEMPQNGSIAQPADLTIETGSEADGAQAVSHFPVDVTATYHLSKLDPSFPQGSGC